MTSSGSPGNPPPDRLSAFAIGRVDHDLSASIESKGRTSIRVRARARARAVLRPDDWLLYYVAKSSCAEAGWSGSSQAFGERTGHLKSDQEAANGFFASRGVGAYLLIQK